MDRPGWQTTEFWISLAALVAGVVLVLKGKEELGGTLISVAVGGYALSRGLAKK